MIEEHLKGPANRYAPYRSWNEYRIAGLLDKYGLPFVYERPTAVMDNGQVRLWYPDYTLSYGFLIEYFGVQGNTDYDRRTQHKLEVYRQNRMDVLPLYQHDMNRSWEGNLLQRIDTMLEHRLTAYRSAVGRAYMAPPSSVRGYR